MTTFSPGDHGSLYGVEWRIVPGRKTPSDLRLEVRAPRFVPVSMAVGFLMADFFTENERTLAQENYLAAWVADDPGRKYMAYLLGSQRMGWEDAHEHLIAERQAKLSRNGVESPA